MTPNYSLFCLWSVQSPPANMHQFIFVGLTFVLVIAMSVSAQGQTAITEFTALPDYGNEGFSYTPESEYAFFKCALSGFDIDTMAIGWSFNGQIFADTSEVNGDLKPRSNVSEIFGFDTSSNLDTGFALIVQDEENMIYTASLDLFIENWRYNGDYQCSICTRGSNGRCVDGLPFLVNSSTYRLNVKYFPPESYPQLESTPPAVGEETTVSCFSYPGYPTVDVTLLKIRGTEEMRLTGEITEPLIPGDLLFYNYTYIPTMDDVDIVYRCTITNTFVSDDEPITQSRSVEMEPLRLVSIPEVKLSGPDTVTYNHSLQLTCAATSPTKDEIVEYSWSTEPSLADDRFSISDSETFKVLSVQEGDSGTVITCRVVDSQGMTASDSYTINAIPPNDTLISDPPIAIIVVACIVGVLLILLVICALCRCCVKREKSGHKYNNHSANVTTSKSNYPDHKSMNGPYTISSTVASQQNSAPLPPYEAGDYKGNGEYKSPVDQPIDEMDGYEYERQRSRENFYPGEERSPDYHYNTGFDGGRQEYPEEYDGRRDYPDGYEVGDFTQPTGRQPAYGQGYDDGYSDQRDPLGYDDYNTPRDGYDDGAPYDTNQIPYDENGLPYDGSRAPYDDNRVPYENDTGPYDDNRTPYDESGVPYDSGAPYGDNYPGQSAGDVPPHDDGYNDAYYPPEQPYPDQDGYRVPDLPYDDGYPPVQGDAYQKDDPNYPYEYEPFGERDQVPDGQEADYQGDPYESYNPPIIDDRLPDGGAPTNDPFYDLYDMKPGNDIGEFDDPQKYQSNAPTPDRFDPSYV